MIELTELKSKEVKIKAQISAINEVLQDLKQKIFMTEEILWDLKRNLEETQRAVFFQIKGLSKDERLAYKAGLTVEEVRLAKSLLNAGLSTFTGVAGKDFVRTLEAKAKPNAQTD
jgi:predicted  nucleic acid-binding Zn-ribbon protein